MAIRGTAKHMKAVSNLLWRLEDIENSLGIRIIPEVGLIEYACEDTDGAVYWVDLGYLGRSSDGEYYMRTTNE